jgi:hypothetical protein
VRYSYEKKKGGGFIREVRVPRMTLTKMKIEIDALRQSLADTERAYKKLTGELAGVSLNRWKLQKRADALAQECGRFQVALRDAVALINACSGLELDTESKAKIEALRLMSILTIEAQSPLIGHRLHCNDGVINRWPSYYKFCPSCGGHNRRLTPEDLKRERG